MPDQLKALLDSGPVRVALMAFLIGVAWANINAQVTQTKLEEDAQLAMIRTDIHAMKVLLCRDTPHDSMCSPATP